MSLVDYPLFSWVVVIHSLHVSSFREAHHQQIIFPVQSASDTQTVGSRTRRRTGGLQQRLYTIPEADCTGKMICWWWASRKLETCREWMTTTHENKGESTSDIVLVIFLNNYNDAWNNECKTWKILKSVIFLSRWHPLQNTLEMRTHHNFGTSLTSVPLFQNLKDFRKSVLDMKYISFSSATLVENLTMKHT